ncbi:MAG: class I SAM-dependent methyltransferase [Verrucomicrobiae bacterium]|nr:class I SAM-dependent methyltransferase [Verrucomicrobiae bacterium]
MNKVKEYLRKGRHRVRRTLNRILPGARVNKIKNLSQLRARLQWIQVPAEVGSVKGQLWPEEQRALYALGAMAESPMLEIGAWLGLSATCLAKGILASGVSKEFITCELNPTPANYRRLPDGQIAFYYPPESEITMGACSPEVYENEIKPVVEHPEGVAGQLRANLKRVNVDSVVQIVTGDFKTALPVRKFRFIFTDTMHEPSEIRRNAPNLLKLVEDGTILACHDTTPENREELGNYFQFSESIQIKTLFIGVIKLRKDGEKGP